MDSELERQVALAKAAVQQARSRAIAHVQAAQSQMQYDVTSLQAQTLEHIQDQQDSETLQSLWAAWVGQAVRARRSRYLLRKAVSHRIARNLGNCFKGWLTARRRLVKERTHELRQKVIEHELQLQRLQGGPASIRTSDATPETSAATSLDTLALESELRSAQQETAAAEELTSRIQETVRDRKRELASVRAHNTATERELAAHRVELEQSLSTVSDATSVEDDPEIARLRELVEKHELQIADAVRTRTYLENSMEEELERLEDDLNQKVQLRTSAILHQDAMRKRLAECKDELKEFRSEIQTASDHDDNAITDTLQRDLQKEISLREASESKLQDQERILAAKQQELVSANEAAEAAVEELHRSTVQLRASVEDQKIEHSGSAKAVELSMDATNRQLQAYEQDLLQARAAIKHAEEELALQRDAHQLRVQSENNAAAGAKVNFDELRTKLQAVQSALKDAKERASMREQDANTESDKLAAQISEQNAAAERSAMQSTAVAQQIESQQSELDEINAEIDDIGNQKHAERLAIDDSVGQQLLEESLGAQSLKFIHDSALRTFSAVEDRLKEAKLQAENMHAKSDAQRLQLTKLVREAQHTRQQADEEHQAALVKQAKLQTEINDTRASVSSLEAALHAKQAELGDMRRKIASVQRMDEAKHAEQTQMLATQEADLARTRRELSEFQTEIHAIRDAHGGKAHEAAMKRRLAEQEVELLRQHLDKLINITPQLRSQCLVAETECRKMHVQVSRTRTRPILQATFQTTLNFVGMLKNTASSSTSTTSSAVDTGIEEYAQRRSPPAVQPKAVSEVDEPVLMDIDTIIRQVAEEHAQLVANDKPPATASRQSPLPKFSPPRSPVRAATSPKRPLRQPELLSPSPGQQEEVEESLSLSQQTPTRRHDSSTAGAANAQARISSPRATGVPTQIDLDGKTATTPVRVSSQTDSGLLQPPRLEFNLDRGADAIEPRARASSPTAVGVSSRMNPENKRAAIAPRDPSRTAHGRPGAIAPREPPEWSRQLEHTSLETGSGLLQPPRLEFTADHSGATFELEVAEDEENGFGMDLDTAGVVIAVAPGGCAAQAGMPVGATIVGVDESPVASRDGIIQALAENYESPWARFRIAMPTP